MKVDRSASLVTMKRCKIRDPRDNSARGARCRLLGTSLRCAPMGPITFPRNLPCRLACSTFLYISTHFPPNTAREFPSLCFISWTFFWMAYICLFNASSWFLNASSLGSNSSYFFKNSLVLASFCSKSTLDCCNNDSSLSMSSIRFVSSDCADPAFFRISSRTECNSWVADCIFFLEKCKSLAMAWMNRSCSLMGSDASLTCCSRECFNMAALLASLDSCCSVSCICSSWFWLLLSDWEAASNSSCRFCILVSISCKRSSSSLSLLWCWWNKLQEKCRRSIDTFFSIFSKAWYCSHSAFSCFVLSMDGCKDCCTVSLRAFKSCMVSFTEA